MITSHIHYTYTSYTHYTLFHKYSKDKYLYLCGDFNIDLIKNDITTNNFQNTLLSMDLIPLINKPTRITINSSTLIDNIFTNNPNKPIVHGIPNSDVSDHLPVFTTYKTNKTKLKNEYIEYRDTSIENIKKLSDNLSNFNFDYAESNSSYSTYINILTNLYNKYCPIKQCSKKISNTNDKPWLSMSIKKCIVKKNILYKKYLSGKCTKLYYKAYKKY